MEAEKGEGFAIELFKVVGQPNQITIYIKTAL